MSQGKTKVYIYTRVSTTMQIDGYSLDAQKARMKAYADFNDYQIVGEYEDAGKSGKSIEGRASFCRMMEDIKSGKDGLDIMGHIGYQIRLQAFAFNLLHKGRIQSAADIIDMLSHILFLAAETDRLYLIMRIAPGNAADCSIQHIPLHCLLKHLMENIPVQHR